MHTPRLSELEGRLLQTPAPGGVSSSEVKAGRSVVSDWRRSFSQSFHQVEPARREATRWTSSPT
jgi:hypothetical protein